MKLSKEISTIFKNDLKESGLKFGDFLESIKHKSFGVFLVILSLPSALPIPAPGYSTPFGILLFFLGLQIVLKRDYLWFPKFITEYKIKLEEDSPLVKGMVRFLEFFEKFSKPRIRVLSNAFFYRLSGFLVVLCSASMILPIPLTNTIPAFGIFLIGLGLIEEDGLITILGTAVALTGITLTSVILYLIAYFGLEGIDLLTNWLGSVV